MFRNATFMIFGAWLRQALLWAGPLYVLAGFVFLLYAASVLIGLPIIILKLDRNKAPADILGGYAGLTSVAITGLVPLTMALELESAPLFISWIRKGGRRQIVLSKHT